MSMMDDCPVKAPKLLSVKSTKVLCACCGAWAYRYPTFIGDDDFFQCEKCGCTSIRNLEGRPYSNKSRQWEWIVSQFNEFFTDIAYWDWDTVVTDPPMKELDWQAIEAWYRSKNIYRMFIEPPQVEIEQTGQNSYKVTVS